MSRTTYPFWRTAPKMRLISAPPLSPRSPDLDSLHFNVRVLRNLLPGRDVARVDVTLLVARHELRRDAEPQQLLLHLGIGERVLQCRRQFSCDRLGKSRRRIHRPGQAAVERHALFLVAGEIPQASRNPPARGQGP